MCEIRHLQDLLDCNNFIYLLTEVIIRVCIFEFGYIIKLNMCLQQNDINILAGHHSCVDSTFGSLSPAKKSFIQFISLSQEAKQNNLSSVSTSGVLESYAIT